MGLSTNTKQRLPTHSKTFQKVSQIQIIPRQKKKIKNKKNPDLIPDLLGKAEIRIILFGNPILVQLLAAAACHYIFTTQRAQDE